MIRVSAGYHLRAGAGEAPLTAAHLPGGASGPQGRVDGETTPHPVGLSLGSSQESQEKTEQGGAAHQVQPTPRRGAGCSRGFPTHLGLISNPTHISDATFKTQGAHGVWHTAGRQMDKAVAEPCPVLLLLSIPGAHCFLMTTLTVALM